MMLRLTAATILVVLAAGSAARAGDITGIWDASPKACAMGDTSDSATTITSTGIYVYEGGDCRIRRTVVKGDRYDITTSCVADEMGNTAGTENWVLTGKGGKGGVLTGTVRYAGTKKKEPIKLYYCKPVEGRQ